MHGVLSKTDFVTEVLGVIPSARLEAYAQKRNDAGGRFLCVLLEVKAWGFQKSRRERTLVYLRFRSVADWMKSAYETQLLPDQVCTLLRALSVEELLQLVWEIAEQAATPDETIAYVQQYADQIGDLDP